jgi:hypothetical protein
MDGIDDRRTETGINGHGYNGYKRFPVLNKRFTVHCEKNLKSFLKEIKILKIKGFG